jgi:7-carboxy-7-deazaguanine synthase
MSADRLPINEIFETIQGEGLWTGTPSIFVRIQGCDVGCPWCDTKHTWELDPLRQITDDEMIVKEKDADTYAICDVLDLADYCGSLESRHVVITGGEPCDHDLALLCQALSSRRKTVQIETSGTAQVRAGHAWVTVSPKVNMPGGKLVLRDAIERADEIKMPVGKMADVERLKGILAALKTTDIPVWLQPLSQSEKATALCIEQARINGWRLSAQLHKYIKVR